MRLKREELITEVAEAYLKNTNIVKHAQSGNNGPYSDMQTPVRNTSHWLITFSWLYERTKKKRYKNLARRYLEYLTSKEARPFGYTFLFRKNTHKDGCGGLIGQAWAVEALATSHKLLHLKGSQETAKEIFSMHPFDERSGLWKRVDVNGKVLSFDSTLNHQIWFAAAGSMLRDENVNTKVECFLNNLESHVTLLENGVIYHPIVDVFNKQTGFTLKKWFVSGFKMQKRDTSTVQKKLTYKSYGYHTFNLYGLSILYKSFPRHSFWKSEKFDKAKNVVTTLNQKDDILKNIYGVTYNPIGFEMPFVVNTFLQKSKDASETVDYWFENQLNMTYNSEKHDLSKNNKDETTLTARIYELTRL